MKNHSTIASNSGGELDTPQWTSHCASWCVLLWQIWSASVLRRLKHATFSCQNKPSSYRVEQGVAARRSESKNKQRVSVLLAGLNSVGCRKTIWGEGRQLESNLAGASDSKRCCPQGATGYVFETWFTSDCGRWECSRSWKVNVIIKNIQVFYSSHVFLTATSLRWSQRTSWGSAPRVNPCLSTQNQVRSRSTASKFNPKLDKFLKMLLLLALINTTLGSPVVNFRDLSCLFCV